MAHTQSSVRWCTRSHEFLTCFLTHFQHSHMLLSAHIFNEIYHCESDPRQGGTKFDRLTEPLPLRWWWAQGWLSGRTTILLNHDYDCEGEEEAVWAWRAQTHSDVTERATLFPRPHFVWIRGYPVSLVLLPHSLASWTIVQNSEIWPRSFFCFCVLSTVIYSANNT